MASGVALFEDKRAHRSWHLLGAYACLAVFAAFFLLPPLSMLVTSLKTSSELTRLTSNPWWIADGMTFEHYRSLLLESAFLRHLANSLTVALLVVVITLAVAIPAAYALARIRFIGAELIANLVLMVYLLPPTLLFIPMFKIVLALGLIDSYWSLVLVYPTLTAPLCTWILSNAFAALPHELDEAAICDGATHWQILRWVLLPAIKPAIAAAGIFAFTIAWGAYIYPLAFIYSGDQMVLTTALVTRLVRGDVYHWGQLMAGGLLAAAPPVLLHVVLLRWHISRSV